MGPDCIVPHLCNTVTDANNFLPTRYNWTCFFDMFVLCFLLKGHSPQREKTLAQPSCLLVINKQHSYMLDITLFWNLCHIRCAYISVHGQKQTGFLVKEWFFFSFPIAIYIFCCCCGVVSKYKILNIWLMKTPQSTTITQYYAFIATEGLIHWRHEMTFKFLYSTSYYHKINIFARCSSFKSR